MSKYFVIAAALMVFAVACNKKETATETAPTTEQTAPAETMPADGNMEAAPMDEAHSTEEAHEGHE
jgi:hypothetical protein